MGVHTRQDSYSVEGREDLGAGDFTEQVAEDTDASERTLLELTDMNARHRLRDVNLVVRGAEASSSPRRPCVRQKVIDIHLAQCL